MEIPRVGPLGLIHQPDGYQATARRYPARLRLMAVVVLGVFVGVSVLTTASKALFMTVWCPDSRSVESNYGIPRG